MPTVPGAVEHGDNKDELFLLAHLVNDSIWEAPG